MGLKALPWYGGEGRGGRIQILFSLLLHLHYVFSFSANRVSVYSSVYPKTFSGTLEQI